jgi:hypothetical protein
MITLNSISWETGRKIERRMKQTQDKLAIQIQTAEFNSQRIYLNFCYASLNDDMRGFYVKKLKRGHDIFLTYQKHTDITEDVFNAHL